MKKVILNKDFGGYGWSKAGTIQVAKRKGILDQCEFYDHDKKVSQSTFLSNKDSWYWDIRCNGTVFEFNRDDEDAIAVLKKFGSEYCSGKFACLEIEEFDDEFHDYSIDDYDGMETLKTVPSIPLDKIDNLSKEELVDLLKKLNLIRGYYTNSSEK